MALSAEVSNMDLKWKAFVLYFAIEAIVFNGYVKTARSETL